MPQPLARTFVHLVFSTKHRHPFIDHAVEQALWAYLAAVCKALDCTPVRIGGHRDHVHILCYHSKNIALKDLVEEVKKRSSKWIKTLDARYAEFYWQSSYAAFSVDPRYLDGLIAYITDQRAHHERQSFQDECRRLFKEFGVEYDEQYVWD